MAKKKKPRPNGESDEMFVEGTPLDEDGVPLSEGEISEEDAGRVPLDAESSRVAAEYRSAAVRKSGGGGGKKVPFNAPSPVKYNLAAKLHPDAHVRIYQREPEPDESFPEKLVSQLPTYEMLRAHVAELWRGDEKAEFRWEIHSGSHPWAVGSIQFREDAMPKYPQYPPPPPHYGAPPAYPQMPPPYGAPPLQGYPPPVYVQQPVQPQVQQPPPAAAPAPTPIQVPPGLDPGMAMLLTTLIGQLNEANARNAALSAQLAQAQYYPQQPAPAEPPAAPKTPLEQLQEMSAMFTGVNDITNTLRKKFVPEDEADAEPVIPNNPDSPIQDAGAVRYLRGPDGEISVPLWANIDKGGALLDGFIDKVKKMFDDLSESRMKHMREQVGLMQEAERISQRTQPQLQHQPQPHVPQAAPPRPAPPVATTPSPVEHPWDRFESIAEDSRPAASPAESSVVETTAEVAD
jgi:hypothetical protein